MPRKASVKTKKITSRKSIKAVKEDVVLTPPVVSSQEKTNEQWLQVQKKLKNPKVLIGLAVLIIVVAALYAVKSWFLVAVVNGQPIFRMQLDSQLEQSNGKQILNSLVTQDLIEQYALSKHVSVSQSEIDGTVKQLTKTLSLQGQTLDSALAAQGMTKSDFLEQIRLQKLVTKLLGNSITVSDKEVNDYIAQNKSSLDPNASPSALQSQARQQLQQQKLSSQAQALVARLQNQAKISYFVSF